ncbi:MAG: acetolactate synthase large subunit, partial [Clostridiales bacterium]|nr:acetolactate synthase large subunit [Clostridiales bacterium]
MGGLYVKKSGAQIIIEQLCAHGVTTVFGYPGSAVLPLYDELYKNAHRINHIITAHEQGAAHAADGYARTSGKTGVVITTSGPGATNIVTGIANAYLDSVPLVAITGNVDVPLLGKDSFQEVDIVGITQPVVKHNFVLRDIQELEFTLHEAFRIAGSDRKGPVLVDIPRNIQTEVCDYQGLAPADTEAPVQIYGDIEEAAAAITRAKRPYIYAGGGVVASRAEKELLELSHRVCAPVGLSMMGITALPAGYEWNLGMCGMHGTYAASIAEAESDLIIALGVRFSERATGDPEAYKRDRTILHIDIDLSEIDKNISANIGICGDIKTVLQKLLEILPQMENGSWLQRIDQLKGQKAVQTTDGLTPKNIIE